jgi:hypothetical protein
MILVMILCLALGAIPLGSKTAFLDLAGSFIILTTVSFGIPIAGHLFSGRRSVKPGPFWMGKIGFFVQATTLLLITFFCILFCFRKCFTLLTRYELTSNSTGVPNHGCHHELQLCHSCWSPCHHYFLVACVWAEKLSRPKDCIAVH